MKAYTSWAFGIVSIREAGTDRILWTDRREYSVTMMNVAFEHASSIAKRNGWTLI